MNASAIIVTRNRRNSLRATLQALGKQQFPAGFNAELLVVDNGSNDGTAASVPCCLPPFSKVLVLIHPHPGQAAGRNLALRHATGTVIAFLDDDVLPTPDWLAELCKPILSGIADAVAGRVELAKELLRPWMTPLHRAWLAETSWLDAPEVTGLVGANMAFHRRTLKQVHGFCEVLGPGALGYGDDQWFAWQLDKAGFRITKPMPPTVIHRPEPQRLMRTSWLKAAVARGRTQAWLGQHGLGWQSRLAPLKLLLARRRLTEWRKSYPLPNHIEGCPETELRLIQRVACLESLIANPKNHAPA